MYLRCKQTLFLPSTESTETVTQSNNNQSPSVNIATPNVAQSNGVSAADGIESNGNNATLCMPFGNLNRISEASIHLFLKIKYISLLLPSLYAFIYEPF